jgi:hypothetical protein
MRHVRSALDTAILDLQSSSAAQTTSLDEGYYLANRRRLARGSTFPLQKNQRLKPFKQECPSLGRGYGKGSAREWTSTQNSSPQRSQETIVFSRLDADVVTRLTPLLFASSPSRLEEGAYCSLRYTKLTVSEGTVTT